MRRVTVSGLKPSAQAAFSSRCILKQAQTFRKSLRKQKGRSFASVAQAFVSAAVRSTSTRPPTLPLNELSQQSIPSYNLERNAGIQGDTSYASQELSRAAAKAVRLSCRNSNSNEAFLIIKSLQASVMHYGASGGRINHPLHDVAIDFRQAVSPRLPIHALLHELLRQGHVNVAGQVAREVVYSRPATRIHDRTLSAIQNALCSSGRKSMMARRSSTAIQLARSNFSNTRLKSPANLNSAIKSVENDSTRVALQLFFAAKQYKRGQGKQMFQQIIDACLLQGEILVVCFLFAFLVKQWQARTALTSLEGDGGSISSMWIDKIVPDGSKYSGRPLQLEQLPSRAWTLDRILELVKPAIRNDSPSDTLLPSIEEAAQALAILAGMLADGLIQRDQLRTLIETLASFPSEPAVKVWTLSRSKSGRWERRDARAYFDTILDQIVDGLTLTDTKFGAQIEGADADVYNILLRYSLRRKLSPAHAEKVVLSMRRNGGPSAVNIGTFNELLRGGTLLRRDDMCTKVLEVLRSLPENAAHPISYEIPRTERDDMLEISSLDVEFKKTTLEEPRNSAEVSEVPQSLNPTEDASSAVLAMFGSAFDTSLLEQSVNDPSVRANIRTLVNYLKYMTACGHPEIVADLVLILIPELKSASGLLIERQLHSTRPKVQHFRRDIAVQRALGLGPQFFVATLNGLVKGGRTNLAERVWRLAKATERVSWALNETGSSAVSAWALPIAAYTIMLQCYSQEMKKCTRRSSAFQDADEQGEPRETRLEMGLNGSAFEVSREKGMQVFRAQQKAVRDCMYINGKMQASGHSPTLAAPHPDARFFNAALQLFGNSRSGKRLPMTQCRRLKRRRLEQLLHTGSTPSADVALLAIAHAMHTAGFELPEGYQHLLVGMGLPPVAVKMFTAHHSPYGHHASKRRAYTLPVSKTKGLPVSNKTKGRKGRVDCLH